MKRPKSIYLAATWCALALLIQVINLARLAKPYTETHQAPPLWLAWLEVIALVFVIWQVTGIIKLRRVRLWIAVIFMSLWSFSLTWNFGFQLLKGAMYPFRIITFWAVLVSLNLSVIWYLSRKSFRLFAAQYAKERDDEVDVQIMNKASKKAMAQEIKKL
jgi:hypothetical protein